MKLTKSLTAIAIVECADFYPTVLLYKQQALKRSKNQPSSWLNLSAKELKAVERYASEYKDYIYKVPQPNLLLLLKPLNVLKNKGLRRYQRKK